MWGTQLLKEARRAPAHYSHCRAEAGGCSSGLFLSHPRPMLLCRRAHRAAERWVWGRYIEYLRGLHARTVHMVRGVSSCANLSSISVALDKSGAPMVTSRRKFHGHFAPFLGGAKGMILRLPTAHDCAFLGAQLVSFSGHEHITNIGPLTVLRFWTLGYSYQIAWLECTPTCVIVSFQRRTTPARTGSFQTKFPF